MEAEAGRETNGCGTEGGRVQRTLVTRWGMLQEERPGRLPCKEGGACLWGQTVPGPEGSHG